MKKQRNKYIELRIPSKYKNVFYEKRELIKQEIDRILNSQREFKEIESNEIYDERVFFTIDELYYQKLKELANKYNMKISKLIRSIFFKLI
ncbi:hypothetical protein CCL42_gp17 [Sulfolobus islandicus rod-shaped virus 8]|uniref:Predicted DNA-binding protein ribbon-helix-helix domain-containing protein n=2 Tax=Usarudivirus TaxID=2843109 RepID=A0A1X9SJE4_9VIRU|nr:hypothetical protein CCL41_gp15 [Sulfolobus islandicus rod-shaped virus 9]YP_009362690.1 hypothetical protein CCL42_gp17 [Sulfolobus islandicus rod-shaped virus 8]ARQ96363.1 hypothetical protein [Sulfolobus islandicus rod-shaped virus 9]ARQ96423.1 hypothetical protein [Sulfolobus islandicus rod-shaped virus 8]